MSYVRSFICKPLEWGDMSGQSLIRKTIFNVYSVPDGATPVFSLQIFPCEYCLHHVSQVAVWALYDHIFERCNRISCFKCVPFILYEFSDGCATSKFASQVGADPL